MRRARRLEREPGGELPPVRKRDSMVRRKLSQADYDMAVDLVRRGVFVCDVAQKLGVHPKTVSRALRRGGPPTGLRPSGTSVIAPFKTLIDRLASRGDLTAVEICERIRAKGYPGSVSTVRRYLRERRQRLKATPTRSHRR